LVLVSAFFMPVLLRPGSLVYPTYATHSDLATIHWPKAALQAQSARDGGAWPLWTPRILSGMPLAANPLAMAFYPLSLIFLALPPAPAFNLLWIVHLWLAGAGAYLWLRRAVGVSRPAAALGALAFAFSGKMIAHLAAGHVSLIAAAAWLPWALLFTDQAVTRDSWPSALGAAAALALQAAAHSQLFLYTAYLALAYGLTAALSLSPETRRSALWGRLARLVLVLVGAGLLSAAQLLPLAEMSLYSNRALSAAEASAHALTPLTLLLGLFLPTAQAGHEPVIYLGLVTLLLLPFAWARRRQWRIVFCTALAVLALLLTLGERTPLYPLLRALPGLGYTRTPARFGFLLALATAALAAAGLDALLAAAWHEVARRWQRLAAVGIVSGSLAVGVGLALMGGATAPAAWGLALLPALSVGALALRCRLAAIRPWLPAAALGALLLLDLWRFDRGLWRAVPPEEVFAPGAEAAAWLADQAGRFRVYSPGYAIEQQVAAEYGLELADGIEPVHLSAYDRYAGLATGVPVEGFSVTLPPFPDGVEIATAHQDAIPDAKLLGLLNIRYLVAAFDVPGQDWTLRACLGETRIFENARFMPRAFVVGQVEPVSDAAEALARLAAVDPRRTALVEGGPSLGGSAAFQEVAVQSAGPDRFEMTVQLSAPGFLVLSEVWYPGWQARDNGEPAAIYRTHGLLRGLYLAPGAHRVVLAFRPPSVYLGGVISGLSCLAGAAYIVWRAARARREAA